MKKLLTVVLCIAVIFTFSFSTSFADTTYTEDDWNTTLTAEYNSIVDALEGTYMTNVLRGITFNDDGFAAYDESGDKFVKGSTADDEAVVGYTKDVIEKVLNDIIDKMEDDMDANKASFLKAEAANYKTVQNTAAEAKAILLGTSTQFTSYAHTDVAATEDGLKDALNAIDNTTVDSEGTKVRAKLNEYQLSVTYDYIVNTKLDVDLTKYNDEDDNYIYTDVSSTYAGKVVGVKYAADGTVDNTSGTVMTATNAIGSVAEGNGTAAITAAEAIDKLIDDTKDALLDVKNSNNFVAATEDADKLKAYTDIYNAYYNVYDDIKNLEDEAYDDASTGSDVSSALDAFAAKGYEQAYAFINGKWNGSDTEDWSTYVDNKADILYPFWSATGTGTKDGKLFDVSIANIEKVTRTEATAVYNAMKAEVDQAKEVVRGYVENEDLKTTAAVAAIGNLYGGNSVAKDTTNARSNTSVQKIPNNVKFMATLNKAMQLEDLYDDVKDEGDKMMAQTKAGVKQYNDTKVKEAIEKAEGFTYAHITEGLDSNGDIKATVAEVLYETCNDIYDNKDGIANLKEEAAKQAIEDLDDAIETAVKKMWDTAKVNETTEAKRVRTGSDKTADEDLVYLMETYASSEKSDWTDIAKDARTALFEAQSYDDIDKALAAAKADFEGLLTKANESDVTKARDAYKKALTGYVAQCKELLDDENAYSKAYKCTGNTNCVCVACKGADLIDDANTVDDVKAAYADAQKLVDNAKSNDELKALKKAAENLITALPSEDKIVADDLTKMEEAYAAVKAYYDEAGCTLPVSNLNTLQTKYKKALAKKADELKDEAEALWDKMDAVNTKSDADLAKFAAYKAEAQALQDKVAAIDDTLDDIEDDEYLTGLTTDFDSDLQTLSKDYAKIVNALSEDKNVVGHGNTATIWGQEVENAKRLLVVANKPGATAAEIKAAQDAYNALTQRQQLCIDKDDYYYNLVAAVIDKDATSVEEIKIIAKSVAKKGSITVTWKIKSGDATNIDGYEIWKSTKHSKGYKKAFTTTSKSYKNTKGLKKGTRYYYKVRAYKVIDGTKYTSDWSNKARRIAK